MGRRREEKGRRNAGPGRIRGVTRGVERASPGSGHGDVPEASFGAARDAAEWRKMYEIHKSLRFC